MPDKMKSKGVNKSARTQVGVVGLGFVGLPLALSYAMAGASVVGLDVSRQLVDDLNAGVTYLHENRGEESIEEILRAQIVAGRFRATAEPLDLMAHCQQVIITVGLPVRRGRPDPRPLLEACRSVAEGVRPGAVIVIRSTLVPGFTDRRIRPVFERFGLQPGRDFTLAYAPERMAEGRAFQELESMPSIVGVVGENGIDRVLGLLRMVVKAPIYRVSSVKAAETIKVVENVQRDVNLAMVQELARFCEASGLDVFEVARLANTHERVKLLNPGPGVGGYCIPNAYYYLKQAADEVGCALDLSPAARRVNDLAPAAVVALLGKELRHFRLTWREARIAVLGLAMKDYSGDDRLSPAAEVVRLLARKGASVKAYDPAVKRSSPTKVESLEECLLGSHAAVILARQEAFKPVSADLMVRLLLPPRILLDTRNMVDQGAAKNSGLHLIRI